MWLPLKPKLGYNEAQCVPFLPYAHRYPDKEEEDSQGEED